MNDSQPRSLFWAQVALYVWAAYPFVRMIIEGEPSPWPVLFGLGAAFAAYELAVAVGTVLRSVELRMPLRERRRRPPASVPRGIAVAPRREVRLEVIRRL